MAATRKAAEHFCGIGRRKSAVARVRLTPGSGNVQINRRPIGDYFGPESGASDRVRAPLVATGCEKEIDVTVRARGGGVEGQTGAIALGVARALLRYNSDYEAVLREKKFLTVDSRRKERKKYGRAGARRSFQFSKR